MPKHVDEKSGEVKTILYIDVWGYLGSDRASAFYFQQVVLPAIVRLARSHSSTVVHALGDAILLTFSNPNDALRCAMELRRAEFASKFKFRMVLHVGTPFVISDPNEGSGVLGLQISQAARLLEIAGKNQVLASAAFVSALKGSLDISVVFDDLGDRLVKGMSNPMKIYGVRSASEPRVIMFPYSKEQEDRGFFPDSVEKVIKDSLRKSTVGFSFEKEAESHLEKNEKGVTVTLSFVSQLELKEFPEMTGDTYVFLRYESTPKKVESKIMVTSIQFSKEPEKERLNELILGFERTAKKIMQDVMNEVVAFLESSDLRTWQA